MIILLVIGKVYNFQSIGQVYKMNRILGFFKQKISEVKQQNKQELQALASVLTESQYSSDRVISTLQSMKSNYMNWNILIANEASTGLYYSQLHNRNICLRKIKGNKELKKQLEKNKLKLSHIKDTAKDLNQITQLNGKWMNNVNKQIDGINQYLTYLENKNANNKQNQNSQQTRDKANEEDNKNNKKSEQVMASSQSSEEQRSHESKEIEIEGSSKNVKIEEIVDDEN